MTLFDIQVFEIETLFDLTEFIGDNFLKADSLIVE